MNGCNYSREVKKHGVLQKRIAANVTGIEYSNFIAQIPKTSRYPYLTSLKIAADFLIKYSTPGSCLTYLSSERF